MRKSETIVLLVLFSGLFHLFRSWTSLRSFHPRRALSNVPNEWATSSVSTSTNTSTQTSHNNILLNRLMSMAVKGGETFVSQPAALKSMLDQKQFCLPWEVNSDAWWTHHPDWSVSFENDTHYCFEPMKEAEKADFFRKLYAVQFQTNCSTVLTKKMWSSGWGADFFNVIHALDYAVQKNMPVQMYNKRGAWHYAATKKGDRPVCPSKDMYCFFLNMTRCEAKRNDLKMEDKVFNGLPRVMTGTRPFEWYKEFATRPQTWLRREAYTHAKNAARQMGLDLIQEKNLTCATMHVRRADVTFSAGRHYYSIQEYVDGMNGTLGHDHPKNIFLLTDDQNAVEEAKRDFPHYNWMFVNRTRFRGTSGGWENQIPSGDPKAEVVVLLSTFRLIKYCPIFVQARSAFADYMWGILREQVPNARRLNLNGWMNQHHVVPTSAPSELPTVSPPVASPANSTAKVSQT